MTPREAAQFWLDKVQKQKDLGKSDREIADWLKISTTELRATRAQFKNLIDQTNKKEESTVK